MKLLICFLLAVTGWTQTGMMRMQRGAAASSGLPFITGQTPGTSRNDFTGCVGFTVDTGASPVTVTDLGRWIISGNSQSHTVSLRDGSGTVLASASVNASGAAPGAYTYASITPTVLSAGNRFYVLSTETSGGDSWYSDDTVITLTAAGATLIGSGLGCDSSVHTNTTGQNSYVPTNFKFTP